MVPVTSIFSNLSAGGGAERGNLASRDSDASYDHAELSGFNLRTKTRLHNGRGLARDSLLITSTPMSNPLPSLPMPMGQARKPSYNQDMHQKPTQNWSARYEPYSSFPSSPPRSSSPPRTPYAARHAYGYAHIRSSPEITSDGAYHGAGEHLDDPSSSWGHRYPRSEHIKYSTTAYNRDSNRSGYSTESFYPPTSDFDTSEYSEDVDIDIPDADSEHTSDSAPGRSSGIDTDSEEEEGQEDEENSFLFGYAGNRRTFFHTSAERGQWKSNPMPFKPAPSILQNRKSAPTLSRVATPTLLNNSRTISEPAPSTSLPESTFVLPPVQDPSDRATEPSASTSTPASAVEELCPASNVAEEEEVESPHTVPSLTSDRESSMDVDDHDILSSPLPPSSPPLFPVSFSVARMSRSISPLSFDPRSEGNGSSSPLSELPDDDDDESTWEPLTVSDVLHDLAKTEDATISVPVSSSSSSDSKAKSESPSPASADAHPSISISQDPEPTSAPNVPKLPIVETALPTQKASVSSSPSVPSVVPLPRETTPSLSVASSSNEILVPPTSAAEKGKAREHVTVVEKKRSNASKENDGVHSSLPHSVATKAHSDKRKKEQGSEEPVKKKQKTESGEEVRNESDSAKVNVGPTGEQIPRKKTVVKRTVEGESETTEKEKDAASEVDAAPKGKRKKRSGGEPSASSSTGRRAGKAPRGSGRRRVSSSYLDDSAGESDVEAERAAASEGPLDPETAALHAQVCGLLIETMAMSRASSLAVSTLFKMVMKSQPALKSQRSDKEWMRLFDRVLHSGEAGRGSGLFGKVESSGKDDADRPLEAQWFYVPELDEDQERAALIKAMMPRPAKRSETKKYKQYYWRPLDKISKWDPEDEL